VLSVREDIHELTNDELCAALDELAHIVRDDMGAKRCAETIAEAAKRLRGSK
jgi:hypothetical protein